MRAQNFGSIALISFVLLLACLAGAVSAGWSAEDGYCEGRAICR